MDHIAAEYRGRSALVTGHTGFKGSWLTLWLKQLGAEVTGYALPPLDPALFSDIGLAADCRDVRGDVLDAEMVQRTVKEARPDVVFHLAAQSLVRESYRSPVRTFETNVIGTLNVLDAVRLVGGPVAVVVVTSDKCYAPQKRSVRFKETDELGGSDPYSASKAACELAVASFRSSFADPGSHADHRIAIATARAGNVIGGGDWAADRIVPDAMRALHAGRTIDIRNPGFVRPWQHVLEPLGGYLELGARLLGLGGSDPVSFGQAWNFGPDTEAERPVKDLVDAIIKDWGSGEWRSAADGGPAETAGLRLDAAKAKRLLGWSPRWSFDEAVRQTVSWYRAWGTDSGPAALRRLCEEQIRQYEAERPAGR